MIAQAAASVVALSCHTETQQPLLILIDCGGMFSALDACHFRECISTQQGLLVGDAGQIRQECVARKFKQDVI